MLLNRRANTSGPAFAFLFFSRIYINPVLCIAAPTVSYQASTNSKNRIHPRRQLELYGYVLKLPNMSNGPQNLFCGEPKIGIPFVGANPVPNSDSGMTLEGSRACLSRML